MTSREKRQLIRSILSPFQVNHLHFAREDLRQEQEEFEQLSLLLQGMLVLHHLVILLLPRVWTGKMVLRSKVPMDPDGELSNKAGPEICVPDGVILVPLRHVPPHCGT